MEPFKEKDFILPGDKFVEMYRQRYRVESEPADGAFQVRELNGRSQTNKIQVFYSDWISQPDRLFIRVGSEFYEIHGRKETPMGVLCRTTFVVFCKWQQSGNPT